MIADLGRDLSVGSVAFEVFSGLCFAEVLVYFKFSTDTAEFAAPAQGYVVQITKGLVDVILIWIIGYCFTALITVLSQT